MSYFETSSPKRPRAWITAQSLAYDWGLTPEYIEHHRKAGFFEGLTRYDHNQKRWLYHSEAIEVLMVEPVELCAGAEFVRTCTCPICS